jgi:hypothetical protein
MSDPTAQTLAGSDTLQIDWYRTGAQRVYVTFTERGCRDLSGPGFGTTFLLRSGFDEIAFKLITATWYQDVPREQVAMVREIAMSYPLRTGYGSCRCRPESVEICRRE